MFRKRTAIFLGLLLICSIFTLGGSSGQEGNRIPPPGIAIFSPDDGINVSGNVTVMGAVEFSTHDNPHIFLHIHGADGANDDVYHNMSFQGPGRYNHLSVRSAVSIILDRILGDW